MYERLRQRISATYARKSTAKLQRNLYDKYIQGIRWASDRIQDSKCGGIVAFITNGGFIGSDSADGLRKTFAREFHKVYCLNLRGTIRSGGFLPKERREQEGDNVFKSGTTTGIAILILIRKGGIAGPEAPIYYYEVADRQKRHDKLALLAANRKRTIPWQTITPDKHGDWINQRSDDFQDLTPLYGEGGIFDVNSPGISTNRDAWCYTTSARKKSTTTLVE